MDNEPHVDESTDGSESSGPLLSLGRRGMLAGMVGVGLLPRYAGGEESSGSRGPPGTPDNAPIEIGSRLEPFVDDYLIESVDGVESEYHHPKPEEVVIEHDEPWEGGHSIYHSVFSDEDHSSPYRMYYRAVGPESANQTAYAESDDGIEWEKPALTDDGTNVVKDLTEAARDLAVFKDGNPNAPDDELYKAIGRANGGLSGYVSPDGFDWTPVDGNPIITKGAFDSHNTAIWDLVEEEYRSFSRAFADGQRVIQTCTSLNFRNWTDPVNLEYPEAPPEQLYINVVKPYLRAPHLWMGFPARYIERDPNSESMQELPGWQLRESLIENRGRSGYALTDMLFMSSRDGQTFSRAPETFYRPGLWDDDALNNWFYGDNYTAWQMVDLESPEPNRPRELSLYTTEKYRTGETVSGNGASQLRRLSMRLDGFVSMHANQTGGEFVTKPVFFEGNSLALNYETSAAGAVRVELQNPDGQPYEGFSLSESPVLFGDDLERYVEFPNADIADLKNHPVRLRFVMSEADVYSFQFAQRPEYSLSVVVENESGDPIEGATVTVNDTSVKTSVDGTAAFGVFNDEYTVRASADGYESGSTEVTVDDSDKSVTLTLEDIVTQPVGHYLLDEIQSDGTVLDASSFGNHGTNNGATVVSGTVDDAFSFNGGGNVDLPDLPTDNSVTIAAWLRSESTPTEYVFDGGGHSYVLYLVGSSDDLQPTWWVSTEGGFTLARDPSIPAGEWVHVAGTFDGTTLQLYIDGELSATSQVGSTALVSEGPCRIGGSLGGGFGFQGDIDDLYVYERALSQSEIQGLIDKA